VCQAIAVPLSTLVMSGAVVLATATTVSSAWTPTPPPTADGARTMHVQVPVPLVTPLRLDVGPPPTVGARVLPLRALAAAFPPPGVRTIVAAGHSWVHALGTRIALVVTGARPSPGSIVTRADPVVAR
jgi:hypothetical protein